MYNRFVFFQLVNFMRRFFLYMFFCVLITSSTIACANTGYINTVNENNAIKDLTGQDDATQKNTENVNVTNNTISTNVSDNQSSTSVDQSIQPSTVQYVVTGQDFTKYDQPLRKTPGTEHQIEIIYFFWYGSPWSYKIDKQLRQWAATRPYPIHFQPSPAAFSNSRQEPYEVFGARIFFALQQLNKEEEISPLLLEAVHKNYVNLSDPSSVIDWMDSHGIPKEIFLKTLNSPQVKSSAASVNYVMDMYNIKSVPSVVIDGQYLIRADDKMPLDRWLGVVEFMADKLSLGGNRP